ncbi:MAG: hypothetical protein H7X71_08065, partial [Chitinophagales bacterium]|nr:hypothetical protein [Chitinophagales bacterium]
MKQIYFTLYIVVSFTLQLSGQSFNYEDVAIKYRLAPKTPFTTEFKTVTVRFQGEEYLKKYGILPSELVSTDYKFERYKNMPAQGDLHLDVSVGAPEYLGATKEKGSRKVNEVEVPYFYYRCSVITPMSYVLRDGARNIIEEKIMFSAEDHKSFFSDNKDSSIELEKYWEEGKNIVISKKMGEVLRSSLADLSTDVRDRFDDQVLAAKVNMFDIKKPEKIQAEFLNTAFTKIKSNLALEPVLTDWDDTKKTAVKDLLMKGTKFSTGDKDQVIAYAIAYYNLAVLNLYWGDVVAAKANLAKGKLSDRKNYEFDQLGEKSAALDGRGVPDAFSSKSYVGTFVEGSDAKLPGVAAVAAGSVASNDFSGKKQSLDTVYVKNGDMIVGYVKAVHKMRKLGVEEIHDFTHLLINPVNMTHDEINVPYGEIVYMKHKNNYLIPLPTNIALSTNPPIHLYEALQVSKNQKLGLMRSGYHESMPYHLSSTENRAFLYTLVTNKEKNEYDLLSVSA